MTKPGGGGDGSDFSTWLPLELAPGTPYRLLELVGEGGHGRLYKAQHVDTDRICALKAIHRLLKAKGNLGKRLKQEAKINVLLLGRPNIAQVLDAGETTDGRAYCVQEWLDGADLRRVLSNGLGFDADWACLIAKPVLAALAAAHERGIVHRDVKPENIFLCDDGLVKLIDFGIAKVLNSKFVQTGPSLMAPGTLRYMPPEALDGGRAAASPATDIYALGVVLWEVLAGEHPFRQSLPKDIAHAVVHEGVPPLDSMPKAVAKTSPALRRVVMRACAHRAADRFPSAEAFFEAIDRAMGYAPPRRPIAAGFYPPGYLGEAPAPQAGGARPALPAPPEAPAPARERSPGTALEPFDPTPRVELTGEAVHSLLVPDPFGPIGQGAAPASPGAHRSSVFERRQGIDSGATPPRAPWLPTHPGPTSDPGRAGARFGALSATPPSAEAPSDQAAGEEQAPNSTPPMVSGTVSKEEARAAEASDEATTLPRAGAPAAERSERALRRAAVRVGAAARAHRAALVSGAGALVLVVAGFGLGRFWSTAPTPGAAPLVAPPAHAPTVGAPLATPPVATLPAGASPAAPPAAAAPIGTSPAAEAVAAPASGPSAPPSAPEAAAPAPSAAPRSSPSTAPALAPTPGGAPGSKGEGARAGAARELREGAPRPTSPRPRRWPKGGIEPGF